MLNPECYEDLITLDTYVQQGKTMDNRGGSIIRLGPSWFTYTIYLVIIYMSNIEAI